MKLTTAVAVAAGAVAASVGVPRPAEAQSLLASDGLGLLVEPLDGRARALGSAGIGLSGWHLLEADPAAGAGLLVPSANGTLQPSSTSLADGSTAGQSRFPAGGASYAIGGNVFSVLFGAFLDQEWEAQVTHDLELGGQTVPAQDTFRSSGSIGRIRFGWARRVTESVAVGGALGSNIGTVERVFTRVLAPTQASSGVEPYQTGERFRSTGAVASFGVAWDPSDLFRLAGSVEWASDMKLTPSGDTEEEERTYQVPLEFRAGGTFTLSQQFALHVGVSYADWSVTEEDLVSDDSSSTVWSYGGGVEWAGLSLMGRPFPLRVGARHRDLPFADAGSSASERTLSGGFGWNLVEGELQPLARFDLGIERGSRDGGPEAEDFWRLAMTVRVASG